MPTYIVRRPSLQFSIDGAFRDYLFRGPFDLQWTGFPVVQALEWNDLDIAFAPAYNNADQLTRQIIPSSPLCF